MGHCYVRLKGQRHAASRVILAPNFCASPSLPACDIVLPIKPRHPQHNGRHERMHLTWKKETTKPAGLNFLQQQAKFDDFIEIFNQERRHEALDMIWVARKLISVRSLPAKLSASKKCRTISGCSVLWIMIAMSERTAQEPSTLSEPERLDAILIQLAPPVEWLDEAGVAERLGAFTNPLAYNVLHLVGPVAQLVRAADS